MRFRVEDFRGIWNLRGLSLQAMPTVDPTVHNYYLPGAIRIPTW